VRNQVVGFGQMPPGLVRERGRRVDDQMVFKKS
jgi:hypothetical protein